MAYLRLAVLGPLAALAWGCSGEATEPTGSSGAAGASGGAAARGGAGGTGTAQAGSGGGGTNAGMGGSKGGAPAAGGTSAGTANGANGGTGTGGDGAGGRGGANDAGRGGNATAGGLSAGGSSGSSAGGGSAGGGSGGTSGGAGGSGGSSDRATEVCRRWTADRMDMSEGTWTGSVAACDAGELMSPGRENALKLVNLYRFLADMPEVEMDPERNEAAQQCALMQSANGLSHEPPETWDCYTEVGAEASGDSSISSGRGVRSIDAYVSDGSAEDTLGHRRWLFSNSLGPVGFGSATASCFHQTGGSGRAGKAFVAWPPPGPVPFATITTNQLDEAGWSIQSDSVDLSEGTVSVMDGDQELPVTQSSLLSGYGSRYALRFLPMGWETEAGHSYMVTVSGTSVSYTVDVIDCGN